MSNATTESQSTTGDMIVVQYDYETPLERGDGTSFMGGASVAFVAVQMPDEGLITNGVKRLYPAGGYKVVNPSWADGLDIRNQHDIDGFRKLLNAIEARWAEASA